MGLGRTLAGVAVLSVLLTGANDLRAAEAGAGVPVPKPPKGRGEECVTETDYIRRYHMVLLDHQRDDTVHDGIRTKQFSLKECIDCHAVKGADGVPVGYGDSAHFCRSCHDYAAVAIDCFECHASKPQGSASATGTGGAEALALKAYLREHGQ